MRKDTPKPPPRTPVLIAVHADGFVEAFADKHVDVKILSVPDCPGDEALAEDTFELLLPRRYRDLYFPNKVRATGNFRRLLPTTIRAALDTAKAIKSLNRLTQSQQGEAA